VDVSTLAKLDFPQAETRRFSLERLLHLRGLHVFEAVRTMKGGAAAVGRLIYRGFKAMRRASAVG
jgi:hypothetical protein